MASDMELDFRKCRTDSEQTTSKQQQQEQSNCITVSSPSQAVATSMCGPLLPSHSASQASEKVSISVEVCLKPTSAARREDVRLAVERMLEKRSMSYVDGPILLTEGDDPFLLENVQSICICDTEGTVDGQRSTKNILLFWQVTLNIFVFQLNEEGAGEELDENEGIANFQDWILPAKEFHGLWESLIFDFDVKQRLVQYAEVALLFSESAVNPHLVSWNRVILLHGPPGTGKTSLCRAIAQKLSIRLSASYQISRITAGGDQCTFAFSKWFSESGKMVTKLFQKIQSFVEDESVLVFLLIDEIESLAAARQAALSGSEPSDSIRVVNALLTQLDRLKAWPNVIVLTTSNITGAIDIAFVDRADIKAYVGPPSLWARYEMLRSSVNELLRVGLLTTSWKKQNGDLILVYSELNQVINGSSPQYKEIPYNVLVSKALFSSASISEGLSGRALRKLPFLAYTSMHDKSRDITTFVYCLEAAVKKEMMEMHNIK